MWDSVPLLFLTKSHKINVYPIFCLSTLEYLSSHSIPRMRGRLQVFMYEYAGFLAGTAYLCHEIGCVCLFCYKTTLLPKEVILGSLGAPQARSSPRRTGLPSRTAKPIPIEDIDDPNGGSLRLARARSDYLAARVYLSTRTRDGSYKPTAPSGRNVAGRRRY